MEELVVFKKEEFDNLLIKFADTLFEDWKAGWGNKVVSRETGAELEKNGLLGSMIPSWSKTLESFK